MISLDTLRHQVIVLSKEVGAFIRQEREAFSADKVEVKGFNNFVSYVDKEAERKFVNGLAALLPESGFIAEEGTSDKTGERYNWIIDPLDGTTNFVHDIPFYCTSVALMDGDSLVMGVIYDPNADDCYHAIADGPAMCDETVIHVTDNATLLDCLLATGFPYDDFDREEDYFAILKTLTHKSRGLRRLGSAAMDLAYVASGRFDAFYEYGLNAWDVAAGAIIVQQAGGRVTDFASGTDYVFGEEIVATNGLIHEEMMQVIGGGFHS